MESLSLTQMSQAVRALLEEREVNLSTLDGGETRFSDLGITRWDVEKLGALPTNADLVAALVRKRIVSILPDIANERFGYETQGIPIPADGLFSGSPALTLPTEREIPAMLSQIRDYIGLKAAADSTIVENEMVILYKLGTGLPRLPVTLPLINQIGILLGDHTQACFNHETELEYALINAQTLTYVDILSGLIYNFNPSDVIPEEVIEEPAPVEEPPVEEPMP